MVLAVYFVFVAVDLSIESLLQLHETRLPVLLCSAVGGMFESGDHEVLLLALILQCPDLFVGEEYLVVGLVELLLQVLDEAVLLAARELRAGED